MKEIDCIQYSPEWWEARRGLPTASDFGCILTPKKEVASAAQDEYIAQLIADAKCLTPNFFTDRPMSRHMEHGRETEAEARDWYAMHTGREVRQVGFLITDDGRFGCSPDGLVDPDGGLELKCPMLKTQIRYLLAGTLPDEYRAQVHGALIVTGRLWWDFVSYAPGAAPLLVRVVPDEYTRKLRVALELFHERLHEAYARINKL